MIYEPLLRRRQKHHASARHFDEGSLGVGIFQVRLDYQLFHLKLGSLLAPMSAFRWNSHPLGLCHRTMPPIEFLTHFILPNTDIPLGYPQIDAESSIGSKINLIASEEVGQHVL